MTTPTPRGAIERAASSWLGRPEPVSESYLRYRDLDRLWQSGIAQWTGSLAPSTLAAAALDWWLHLLGSPAKQLELVQLASQPPTDALQPLPQDKRFADPAWQGWPFDGIRQGFLLTQRLWQHATQGVPGVTRHHEAMVAFCARQWLDMLCPANHPLTNPVVLERTLAEGGANLLRGWHHALDDLRRDVLDLPPAGAEDFQVGKQIAVTAGQVVLRTPLAELIQYQPSTARVRREPILVVPAWIMKYPVLDLSPRNSMVRALVAQGFTVFMLSWKNPVPQDREVGLSDYFTHGILAALNAIAKVRPDTPTHAVGYCLGGTLLAMAACLLAQQQPRALKTLTLLAAQTDFTHPGELGLFIDEGQVDLLDAIMWRQGVLSARQMRSTFHMLRSQDLIWSYRVGSYLLGERQPCTDLMAWNADGPRLPYRMHSEYLHSLFLDNALAHGQARLTDQPINLADIRVPIFNVGAVQDHVAPWRSVYQLHTLTDAEQTFVLTAGGHNVGIVNPPGVTPTSHRLRRWRAGDRLLTADEWLASTPIHSNSWWLPWFAWLHQHSGPWRRPPAMGAPTRGLKPLASAPGTYVLQR